MEKILFIFLLSLVGNITAQEGFVFSGKIVGDNGTPVEYATIGIPGKNIGSFTATDGTFALHIPARFSDTLHISHVSYKTVEVATMLLPQCDTVITMRAKALHEVVVYDGEKRRATLAGNGMHIPGAATMWSVVNIGCEIGSVIETDKVFEVREIKFKVRSNNIHGAKFSVNIYKTDEASSEFHNTLCTPVYIDIPVNESKQEINIELDESILVEQGRYFVSIKFVDYDRSAPGSEAGRIYFPLYLKKSYIRNGIMDTPESIAVNMGLAVKGYEYR